jgi:hypothetical protein
MYINIGWYMTSVGRDSSVGIATRYGPCVRQKVDVFCKVVLSGGV